MSANSSQFMESCFLQDLIDGTRIVFQYTMPEVPLMKAASYGESDVLGRAMPVRGYQSSPAKMISLNLQFFADGPLGYTRQNIKQTHAWFESLPYPDYRSGLVAPPHKVFLSLGEMIDMTCIVMDVAPVLSGPWDIKGDHAKLLDVSINLAEVDHIRRGIEDYASIRRRGGAPTPGDIPDGEVYLENIQGATPASGIDLNSVNLSSLRNPFEAPSGYESFGISTSAGRGVGQQSVNFSGFDVSRALNSIPSLQSLLNMSGLG